MRIIEHEQLFGRVADRAGVVDHQCFAGDAFQQVGRGDVTDIERRILPHQHDVDVGAEVQHFNVAGAEMIAIDVLHGHRPGAGTNPAVLIAQVIGQIMVEAVAALLGAKHQRESRIAGNANRFERVHLHGDG